MITIIVIPVVLGACGSVGYIASLALVAILERVVPGFAYDPEREGGREGIDYEPFVEQANAWLRVQKATLAPGPEDLDRLIVLARSLPDPDPTPLRTRRLAAAGGLS